MAKLGNCHMEPCCVNDAVCSTVHVVNQSLVTVWTNESPFNINGTIVVENPLQDGNATQQTVRLIITGSSGTDVNIAPGQTVALTVRGLHIIQVQGLTTGTTDVKVSFSLNYKF
ncbi:S-Ena type endospore appendage [Rummeliibacillus pycnus]|uniref:S-Ena type endospore appendage n=1 Tax=Rummeliibacillus pycnus TaxID=101070 RepID=UPI000C9C0290|nr:S-Ena type endospore appendage [Rummeliibacillus pycnus]